MAPTPLLRIFRVFTERSQKLPDPAHDRIVPFDFAGPAALGGVLGELLFAGQAGAEARGVLAGGEEL